MYTFEPLSTNEKIAMIAALDSTVLNHVDEAADLIGNAYYQGFDGIVIKKTNLPKSFFDLSTRLAGDVLQKFSNYRMRLFIVGNFSKNTSKSLTDFIRESNKGRIINFVSNMDEITG